MKTKIILAFIVLAFLCSPALHAINELYDAIRTGEENGKTEDQIKHEVEALLAKGANPNGDEEGRVPLSMAATKNYVNVAKVLLDYHADINKKGDSFERSALHEAVHKGHINMTKFLLEQGANPNTIDVSRDTPLHTIARTIRTYSPDQTINITRLLLQHGAQWNKKNKKGKTPLEVAKMRTYPLFAGTNGENELFLQTVEGWQKKMLPKGKEIFEDIEFQFGGEEL